MYILIMYTRCFNLMLLLLAACLVDPVEVQKVLFQIVFHKRMRRIEEYQTLPIHMISDEKLKSRCAIRVTSIVSNVSSF